MDHHVIMKKYRMFLYGMIVDVYKRQTIETEGEGSRRAEGRVLRVLEHANRTVIGYYQKNKNFGFVIPDNQKIGKDIFIPQGKDMGCLLYTSRCV